MRIPQTGMDKAELMDALEGFRANDVPWREGRAWGLLYDPGEEAEHVIKTAFTSYLTENALDPTVFPSLLRFENEVVAMSIDHLHGDEDVVGTFTSGGTESIILATKSARDYYRDHKPEITAPEMILPTTAHAAFHKAAYYLGLNVVNVPVDGTSFKADVDAMRAAITPNTVMIVGSACSYGHGVIDPIEALGQLALEHDLWFHVDGCIGGFLLQYFRRLGADVPLFDWRVPGVTSISMDLHKYAFAAKGASTISYRSKKYRKYQMYACANWTGYTIVNSTVQSTKSGGPIAAAWAAMNFIGDDGYLKMSAQMYDATRAMVEGLKQIEGIRLLGEPDMNLIAYASDEIDVFVLADRLKRRGWYVQPQLSFQNSPANIHLSVNPAGEKWVEALLNDTRECVAELLSERGEAKEPGTLEMMKQMLSSISLEDLDDDAIEGMMSMVGVGGGDVPGEMAEINNILDFISPSVREKILCAFFNEMFVATK